MKLQSKHWTSFLTSNQCNSWCATVSQMYSQYASKQPEGRDYEKRSMCFDDPYKVVDEEIRLRENFIVDSCWGGRKSLSKKKTISYLEGARDQSCAGADELVDRLLFDQYKNC